MAGQMTPRAVTRGETTLPPSPRTSVLVDWVSVVFPGSAVGPQGEFLKTIRRLFDGTVTEFRSRPGGLHGYRASAVSDQGGVILAWGGNNDTVFLQLPGDACARVDDWQGFRAFVEAHAGHLTRCDLAFDDLEGMHTVDEAVQRYIEGAFVSRKGGARSGDTKVSCSQAGNWVTPDGSGRTFYVGKARNGKMLRVYEKGKQLGDKSSPWVRWEAQLTNRDRELPLEMLVNPAPYFRGAYPALEFVEGDACRICTRRAQERISVEKLSRHAREAYGPLLDVLVRSGATAVEVVERIRRDGLPRRLSKPTAQELQDRCNALAQMAAHEELESMAYVESWSDSTGLRPTDR